MPLDAAAFDRQELGRERLYVLPEASDACRAQTCLPKMVGVLGHRPPGARGRLPMMLVPTLLKPSGIHGMGIYAAEPIAAGTRIWELRRGFDMILEEKDLPSLPAHVQDFVYRYCYPLTGEPGRLVLESDHGRFMNHAVPGNTDFSRAGGGYARVDIAAGEELTCDYGEFCPGYVLMG